MLVEVLLALALTAMLMVPLAQLFSGAINGNAAAVSALTLDADLHFALDRIEARALAVVPAVPPSGGSDVQDVSTWLGTVSYALSGTNLVETDTSVSPARVSVIAANVQAFALSAPDIAGGTPLIRADLTLAVNGASAQGSRVVRVGGPF